MEELFLRILNLSITASYIVGAVIFLRLVLKNAPRWTVCALWALVAIRLLCPFSIESALSLIPTTETVTPEVFYTTQVMSPTPETVPAVISEPFYTEPIAETAQTSETPSAAVPEAAALSPAAIAAVVWATGAGFLLLYGAGSYLLLRRRMSTAVRCKGNLWQSENVTSPFVLGFFRPNIYLPFGLDNNTLTHVVAHEWAHIRRLDHWTKPLAYALLAVHWFNPLMWAAFVLFCRDIELACDEKVVRELDANARREYATALLACGMKGPRPRLAACPLAFGEVGVKTRVKGVMHYKKPAFWAVIAALLLCVATAVCLLTNPVNAEENSPAPGVLYTDSFMNQEGTLTFNFSLVPISVPDLPETVPVLQIAPKEITPEQAQQIAAGIFGDSPIYAYIEDQRTKADVEAAIAVTEDFLARKEELFASDKIVTQSSLEFYTDTAERKLANYREELLTAPETLTHSPCDWTFHPVSYYDESILDPNPDPYDTYWKNESILATAYIGDIPYTLNFTRRDEEDFRLQSIFIYVDTYRVETLYQEFTSALPTEADIQAAIGEAQRILNATGLENYIVTSYSASKYGIDIIAYPTYEDILCPWAKGVGPTIKTTAQSYMGSNFYQEKITLTFREGTLFCFELQAQAEVVETVNEDYHMLSCTEALAHLKTHMTEGSCIDWTAGVSGTIDITSVQFGYARIPIGDGTGDFQLIPAYYFFGTPSYKSFPMPSEGEPVLALPEAGEVLAIISAVDGSLLN